ncbi:MAG: hypothetical protein JW888_03700 [Pirellulales bacterium]|nr:hypothetical protein [Pirellulales bacterium]
MLLLNQERIEFAYEKAKVDGMDDPMVVVLDLQDERAGRLAQWTGLPRPQIERWQVEYDGHGPAPTRILAAPRWAVLAVVGPMTPNSPEGIVKPNPPGTFRVLAIASGGIAFADFPQNGVS